MKFLLDMPVSRETAIWLKTAGHDVLHAGDIGLTRAPDEEILERARQEKRIVLTMDLDFPHLLSTLSAEEPGVVLIRLRHPTARAVQDRLVILLRMISESQLARAIAVIEEDRIRLHYLPIK